MARRKLLSTQEACWYLGISRTTLLKTEEEGLIRPTRTVGGHRRYSHEALDQYIKATTELKTPAESVIHDMRGQVVFPKIVERLAWSSALTDNTMKDVLQDLVRLLQADAGLVALLDADNVLRTRVTVGMAIPHALRSAPISSEGTFSGKVLEFRQPLVYEGSESDIHLEGLTQGVCAPLVYRGTPLGVIHVLSLSRHQFFPTEVRFTSLVALYLASLIVNSQLLADSRQREEELSYLNSLNQALQEQQDVNRMADVLLKETLRITKADAGIVFLCSDSSEVRIAAVRGHLTSMDSGLADKLAAVVTEALNSEEPYLLSVSPHNSSLYAYISPLLDNMGSIVLLPLRSQGERLGALQLCSRSPWNAHQWQASFLTAVCAQAALIIQRVVLCQRLTEMSQNERMLRRYYEKMIASAPVAMEIIDKDCRIIAWNEAAEELTGIPREEALEADKFRLQPGLLKYNGPEILARVFETKQVSKIESFPYERRDGTVRYVDVTFLPFTEEDEEIAAIIVFVQDVTELESLRLRDISMEPAAHAVGSLNAT